jgi:hypothetical protein
VRACLERNAKSSSVHTIIAELVVEATGWIYHTRQLEEARDRRDVGGEEGRFAGRARGSEGSASKKCHAKSFFCRVEVHTKSYQYQYD